MTHPDPIDNLAANVLAVARRIESDEDREEFIRLMREANALGRRVAALRTAGWALARANGAVGRLPRSG
jgi:hypothetical protein